LVFGITFHSGDIRVVPTHLVLSITRAVRKDMDVNKHERLSNLTLRHKWK